MKALKFLPQLIISFGSHAKLAIDLFVQLWWGYFGCPPPECLKIIVIETNKGASQIEYPVLFTDKHKQAELDTEPYKLTKLKMFPSHHLINQLNPGAAAFDPTLTWIDPSTVRDAQELDGIRESGAGHRRQYAAWQFHASWREEEIGQNFRGGYAQIQSESIQEKDKKRFHRFGYNLIIERTIRPPILYVQGSTGATNAPVLMTVYYNRTFASGLHKGLMSLPDMRTVADPEQALLSGNAVAVLNEVDYFSRHGTTYDHTYPDGTTISDSRSPFDMLSVYSPYALSIPDSGFRSIPNLKKSAMEIAKSLFVSVLGGHISVTESFANANPKRSAILTLQEERKNEEK